jgi:serralysin
LESLKASFRQDLNGDGVVGIKGTTIESFGSTSLVQVGNNFYSNNSDGTGPEFKSGGTAVTAGEFGAWTFIGAEQTTNGEYQVALHLPALVRSSIRTSRDLFVTVFCPSELGDFVV